MSFRKLTEREHETLFWIATTIVIVLSLISVITFIISLFTPTAICTPPDVQLPTI